MAPGFFDASFGRRSRDLCSWFEFRPLFPFVSEFFEFLLN